MPLTSWKSRVLTPTIPIGRLIGGCVPLNSGRIVPPSSLGDFGRLIGGCEPLNFYRIMPTSLCEICKTR